MIIEQLTTYLPEFLSLAIAHAIAVASPGPDFAIVTKNTVSYGKKTGQITALGVGVAILLHVSYALLGFSLLIKSNPTVYQVILWLGALFLVYLGIMSLRAPAPDFSTNGLSENKRISNKKAFTLGFMTNAINVKAALFFLFLFTSIVGETTPMHIKIGFGGWVSLYTFGWFYFIASVFGTQKVRAFFTRFGVWFDRVMGIILILLAILLLIK